MAQKKPAAGSAPAAASSSAASSSASSASCSVERCKQPLRAKGYCRKHFMAWRRAELGKHHRYKVCSKEGCRKPRAIGGLCAEHAGKGQPAEGAPT
jgi:hypothetical protein